MENDTVVKMNILDNYIKRKSHKVRNIFSKIYITKQCISAYVCKGT